MIYILLFVGTEQIRHPWPFLGFWRGLGLWPHFFCFESVDICCVYLFKKKLSRSTSPMLKITKPNYLTILLHPPVLLNKNCQNDHCVSKTHLLALYIHQFGFSLDDSLWSRNVTSHSKGSQLNLKISLTFLKQEQKLIPSEIVSKNVVLGHDNAYK